MIHKKYTATQVFSQQEQLSHSLDSSGDSLLLLNTSLSFLSLSCLPFVEEVCLSVSSEAEVRLPFFIFVTSLTLLKKNLQSDEFIVKSPESGRSQKEREEDEDKSC